MGQSQFEIHRLALLLRITTHHFSQLFVCSLDIFRPVFPSHVSHKTPENIRKLMKISYIIQMDILNSLMDRQISIFCIGPTEILGYLMRLSSNYLKKGQQGQ